VEKFSLFLSLINQMIFLKVFFLFLGCMLCAEQNSGLFLDYKESIELLLEDMKMNICNVFLLSKIKSSLYELNHSDDVDSLTKHLVIFFSSQEIRAFHKFVVYALYHLPSTFSNFGVFEPFFKPFNETKFDDLYLPVKWILDSIGPFKLSEAEEVYKINEWIDSAEYKVFTFELLKYLQQLGSFNNIRVNVYPFGDIITMVYNKFISNPQNVLKMALFEKEPRFLPLLVYIYLNPSLTSANCVNDLVLNGLIKPYPNGLEATRSLEFLNQTIVHLKHYKPIVISEMFTDLVRGNLENFLQSKLESVSKTIIL
jgi:hypothetical protein